LRIRDCLSNRIEEGLQSLGQTHREEPKRIGRGGALQRQIGRLSERNDRASGRYSISLTEDKAKPTGIRLKWIGRPEWDDWTDEEL
jgi:hypothetical protein